MSIRTEHNPKTYATGLASIAERTGRRSEDIAHAERWVVGEMMVRKGWGSIDQPRFLRMVELVLSGQDPFTEVSE